jgi:hypothetical protein
MMPMMLMRKAKPRAIKIYIDDNMRQLMTVAAVNFIPMISTIQRQAQRF